MPNLKKSERSLPEVPGRRSQTSYAETSDYMDGYDTYDTYNSRDQDNENELELCRSVSIKDRKRMLEHYARRASSLEQNRHWRSLPSLEQSPERITRAGSGRHWRREPEKAAKGQDEAQARQAGSGRKSPHPRPMSVPVGFNASIRASDQQSTELMSSRRHKGRSDERRRSEERSPQRPVNVPSHHYKVNRKDSPASQPNRPGSSSSQSEERQSRRSPYRRDSSSSAGPQRDDYESTGRPIVVYDDPDPHNTQRERRVESPFRSANISLRQYNDKYDYSPRVQREQSPYRPVSAAPSFQRGSATRGSMRSESPARPSSSAASVQRLGSGSDSWRGDYIERQYSGQQRPEYIRERVYSNETEVPKRPKTILLQPSTAVQVSSRPGERRLYGDLVAPFNRSTAAYQQDYRRPPSPAYRQATHMITKLFGIFILNKKNSLKLSLILNEYKAFGMKRFKKSLFLVTSNQSTLLSFRFDFVKRIQYTCISSMVVECLVFRSYELTDDDGMASPSSNYSSSTPPSVIQGECNEF